MKIILIQCLRGIRSHVAASHRALWIGAVIYMTALLPALRGLPLSTRSLYDNLLADAIVAAAIGVNVFYGRGLSWRGAVATAMVLAASAPAALFLYFSALNSMVAKEDVSFAFLDPMFPTEIVRFVFLWFLAFILVAISLAWRLILSLGTWENERTDARGRGRAQPGGGTSKRAGAKSNANATSGSPPKGQASDPGAVKSTSATDMNSEPPNTSDHRRVGGTDTKDDSPASSFAREPGAACDASQFESEFRGSKSWRAHPFARTGVASLLVIATILGFGAGWASHAAISMKHDDSAAISTTVMTRSATDPVPDAAVHWFAGVGGHAIFG